MRIVVALAAFGAGIALAQGPSEFRDRAPLTLPQVASMYRVALPEAAYRDGRPDLADVRVFNARGEPVPIALASEPEPTRETPAPARLAIFPLTSLDSPPAASRVQVRLADGTSINVDADARAAVSERRLAAYFLDASGVKNPMHALRLDWEVLPTQEVVKARVEASDDLRTWREVAGPTMLVRMEQEGRRLDQPLIPLDGTRAKYLRVVPVGAPFALKSAFAEFEERSRPADLAVKRVAGSAGSRPGEVVYDIGGRFPVEAVRVIPADAHSVIATALFVRDGTESNPSWVGEATFYRLTRDGAEIESLASPIRRRSARYWIVRTDPEKGGYGAALPQLEVSWRAAQLVFVARGEGPFTLAFGDPSAKPALLPIASIIPGYEAHAELRLPEAAVGAIASGARPNDALPEWLQEVPPRNLALWAILVAAVVILGLMAWRLARKV
jgi:hypothetical protein